MRSATCIEIRASKTKVGFLGALVLVAMGGVYTGWGAESPVGANRELMRQWMEAKKVIATEKANWEEGKSTLERTLDLLNTEMGQLRTKLDQMGTDQGQAQKERQLLETEQVQLQEYFLAVKQYCIEMEGRVRGLYQRLPEPLKDKIQPLWNRLPENSNTTKATLTERMQNLVGFLSELDKFNGSLWVFRELRSMSGGDQVQVQVLYLGLAAAYYVDQEGKEAGVGKPGAGGWEWSPKKDLASTISKAIAIYENRQPAAFVQLPITIQ